MSFNLEAERAQACPQGHGEWNVPPDGSCWGGEPGGGQALGGCTGAVGQTLDPSPVVMACFLQVEVPGVDLETVDNLGRSLVEVARSYEVYDIGQILLEFSWETPIS